MRPHILYVTPIFGYPAFGGPRLRTYNTLRALARCADVSLFLTQQADTADVEATRAHLLTFCRTVVLPEPNPAAGSHSGVRAAARAMLPARVQRAVRWLRAALRQLGPALRGVAEKSRDGATRPSGYVYSNGVRPLLASGRGLFGRTPRRSAPGVQTASSEPAGRDPAIIAALREWIQAHQPDLVWLGFGGISYDLVPLKAQTGTPLVLETECVWSRFVLRELPFASDAGRRQQIEREGRAKEAEERSGAPLVDITTAVSEVDAAYFRSLVPDAGRVMPLANVIDVEAYQTSPSAVRLEQPALVFAGTLSHGTANVDAGCWLVDEVLPRVWRRRPDVHLYVVGRSPAPEILARRARQVHVTGEVRSIVPYMRASVAALVPLRWESGTRFKILEAFACKTPVVSTSLGAEGLDIQHGCHLLLADNPDTFAGAILSLLEDPTLGQRLVEPAYELVRREYDLSSAERQINAVLARLGLSVGVAVP
ncbi:MAG: glycosyltransferase family 4 protein [Chloroflexota bacterium]|nr:glycosyltransferase family 4 protein [Chloroflexota bacterium]